MLLSLVAAPAIGRSDYTEPHAWNLTDMETNFDTEDACRTYFGKFGRPTGFRSLQRGSGQAWRLMSRWLGRALMLAGALIVLVESSPLTEIWARALAGPWSEPAGDVLIVLASDALKDHVIGESSYWRSVYALRAFRKGKFARILISGGPADPGHSVAELMRDFLVASGIPPALIETEVESRSTRENALFVAALLRNVPGTKVLLTSDYHMWRASRCFKRAGMNVLLRPIPDAVKLSGSWVGRWPAFWQLVEESVKILYYRARGWI